LVLFFKKEQSSFYMTGAGSPAGGREISGASGPGRSVPGGGSGGAWGTGGVTGSGAVWAWIIIR
jgi:hypothetical protein